MDQQDTITHEPMAEGERWTWRDFGSGPMLCTERGGAKVVLTASQTFTRSDGPGAMLTTRDGRGVLRPVHPDDPRMRVIEAAPDLLAAAKLLEAAEDFYHNDCDECGGHGEPEACAKCFPLFDDARVARRLAIAKAEGRA